MFTLYTARKTGGFAPHAILEEAGATYTLENVDLQAGEHLTSAFRALNPLAQVPVLIRPDGALMTESAAMVIWLADTFPQCGLAPRQQDPARADYLHWMTFMAVNLYGAGLRVYHANVYPSAVKAHPGLRDLARQEIDSYLSIIERRLSETPFLAGEQPSAADIYLLMLASWHPAQAELQPQCPRISAVCTQIRQRPAVKHINEWHKLW